MLNFMCQHFFFVFRQWLKHSLWKQSVVESVKTVSDSDNPGWHGVVTGNNNTGQPCLVVKCGIEKASFSYET